MADFLFRSDLKEKYQVLEQLHSLESDYEIKVQHSYLCNFDHLCDWLCYWVTNVWLRYIVGVLGLVLVVPASRKDYLWVDKLEGLGSSH